MQEEPNREHRGAQVLQFRTRGPIPAPRTLPMMTEQTAMLVVSMTRSGVAQRLPETSAVAADLVEWARRLEECAWPGR